MEKLRSDIDAVAASLQRHDSPTGPTRRFQHFDIEAAFAQPIRRRKPAEARSDDNYSLLFARHGSSGNAIVVRI
jgi:hypothetical protein